jgi:hypothetical protein
MHLPGYQTRGNLSAVCAHGVDLLHCLRDERQTRAAMQAINGKVAAIYCEDLAKAFSFSNAQQRCISQVHRSVRILTHQLANTWNVCGVE